MESDEKRKLVQEFTSFTGTMDEERAQTFLEASNWRLPDAVQLFYAEQTAVASAGAEPSHAAGDDEVRPPLPSKLERIVDRTAHYEHLLQRKAKQTPVREVFRNHTAELAEYEQGPNAEGGTKGLAKLYRGPIDILFRGSFEDAKEVAMEKNLWLMVNIQSAEEFASHQLNRDTFSNGALKEMIKAHFIFLQTYIDGVTGQKLMTYYKIERFPCILIIDPVTGGLMQAFNGFVGADRLIEDIVEYMDCSPADGSASRLMRRMQQKSKGRTRAQSSSGEGQVQENRTVEDSFKRKSGEEGLEYSSDAIMMEAENEDSEEQEELTQPFQKCREAEPVAEMTTVQPVVSLVPEASGEDTCTVAILLPDGSRVQRLFYKHDKVESLYGFCNEQYEAARSRSYKLKPRMPGSVPLEDFSLSLEEAQVEGSLLALSWE